jgi:hypothetical protein
MVYNGPSSLPSSRLLDSAAAKSFTFATYPIPPLGLDIDNIPARTNALCVDNFFRWHYPQCLTIDRDQYLLEYTRYSSSAIQYSICALGALMSSDSSVRVLAEIYAAAAMKKLEATSLLYPCESSIQALLLCSYYSIGKGNFSEAWMLSGMVFSLRHQAGYG